MNKRVKNYILILVLFIACGNLSAQHRAEFTVNAERGCAPFTVTVFEDTDITGSTGTQYNYGDEPEIKSATSHTYTTPGTYTITQYLQNDFANPRSITKEIVVTDGEAPSFNYYVCRENTIFINIDDEKYPAYLISFGNGVTRTVAAHETLEETFPNSNPVDVTIKGLAYAGGDENHAANIHCGIATERITPLNALPDPILDQINIMDNERIELNYNIIPKGNYRIEMAVNGDDSFTEIGTPSLSSRFVVNGLNTGANIYCFRIVLTDPCINEVRYSNQVCTTTSEAIAQNNQNSINWAMPPGPIRNYEIYRNDALYATITDPNTVSYIDNDVECNQRYCYEIKVNYSKGESINADHCIRGFSTVAPPPISDITANVYDNDVHLEWQATEVRAKNYRILRSGNNDYQAAGQTTTQMYVDKGVNIARNYHCYKVYYEDECGNISPDGIEACPVLLTVTENEAHHYELTWTHYQGWADGVAYYLLEKIDKDGNVFETINLPASNNFYTDNSDNDNRQSIIYRITAVSNNPDNWQSYSNAVLTYRQVRVFLPSAFTPNGDGLNDEFLAKGKFVQDLEIKIFNRWGELIFFSADKSVGWDGMYKGTMAPEGTYVYKLMATDYNGQTITQSGSFKLLRKGRN